MTEAERRDPRRRASRTLRDALLLLALLAVLPTVRISFPDRPGTRAAGAPAPAPVIAPAVARPPDKLDATCPISGEPLPAPNTIAVRRVVDHRQG